MNSDTITGTGPTPADTTTPAADTTAPVEPPPKKRRTRVPFHQKPDYVRKQLQSLNDRASKGDRDAVGNLERMLARWPGLLAQVATLASEAEAAWVDRAAGGDFVKAKAYRAGAADLRAELLGGGASPVERLLVDHVVVAHLALKDAENREAHQYAAGADGRHRMARVESTQKRLLAAVKALTLVRGKLATDGAATPGGTAGGGEG